MSEDIQDLYEFLKFTDDEVDIVCLECRERAKNYQDLECFDYHMNRTLDNMHDSPGVYYFRRCLEYLDEEKVIDLDR